MYEYPWVLDSLGIKKQQLKLNKTNSKHTYQTYDEGKKAKD
jgi:hypothetical protein